jgi:predicted RNA methylase
MRGMSATGRNVKGSERSGIDFYRTPGWCTRSIVERLWRDPQRKVADCEGALWVDAGAGDGAISAELLRWGVPPGNLVAVENNGLLASRCRRSLPDTANVACENFLGWSPVSTGVGRSPARRAVVMMNPPFGQAREFVEHALGFASCVVCLLRINFLEGQGRADFHRRHPGDVYVMSRRPSFTGKGTDATGYCWMAWGLPAQGGRWEILDLSAEPPGPAAP